ncbi:hypothetical protein KIH87_01820 [Paraneptunicella aestuarii]|uniref:hypothetical protein n=1 Tax=Paraneptunicella aestuarii TaxID=2831148 RepID=UPI001E2F8F58|nr:hypothetical protein [Paraneptunicella aestuarii]UAA39130.1 hypothetical protein KIH87_01820 [Paraneptunicella aestuarii]
MAIQDNNPERRNLMIMSLSIIVFYLAGGEVTDHNIRLQIVNVHFTKPEILGYFVWILLVWFAFRYWLVHQGSWVEEHYRDLANIPKWLYEHHAIKKLNLGNDYSNSYYEDRHWITINVSWQGITLSRLFKNEDGTQGREDYEVKSPVRHILMFAGTVYILFKKPNLTGYFAPYILFFGAIWIGLSHEL